MIHKQKPVDTYFLEDFIDVTKIENETFERCIFTSKNNEQYRQFPLFQFEKCIFKNVRFEGNFYIDNAFIECTFDDVRFNVKFGGDLVKCTIGWNGLEFNNSYTSGRITQMHFSRHLSIFTK
ncbi:MAG: hypothetical protein U5N85_05520 [Arcicella sp.]|nr:hypothetical protein [Arcicella sp.]